MWSGSREACVAPFLLAVQQIFDNFMLKKIELCFVTKKTCLIDSQIFDELQKLFLTLLADEQPIVAVEGVDATLFEPAL